VRRLFARNSTASPTRPSSTGGDGPRAQVDSAWVLDDGSLCIDGWLPTTPTESGDVYARVVTSSAGVQPAGRLFRKHRPDVAAHLLGGSGYQAGTADLGFVGHVPGHVTPGEPFSLEVSCDLGSAVTQPLLVTSDAVPEEAFMGLAIDPDTITPTSIASLASVMRHSFPKPLPAATTAYAHSSLETVASVNVVVPVYGGFTYLRNLLLALAGAQTGAAELTIVCDDPRIADELVTWAGRWNEAVYDARVRVLVHDRNGGFAAACNSGWQASLSPLHLLLNSDVIVDSLAADLAHLSSLLVEGVAAVAPVLLFPDGSLQHDGMILVEPDNLPGFTVPGHPGKGLAPAAWSGPFDAELLTGAAILTTTEVLQEVGGVPPVYGRGDFEDVLLSVAMSRLGRLVVDPDVRWTHVEGVSYDRDQHGGLPVTLAKSMVIAERLKELS